MILAASSKSAGSVRRMAAATCRARSTSSRPPRPFDASATKRRSGKPAWAERSMRADAPHHRLVEVVLERLGHQRSRRERAFGLRQLA